MLQIEWYPSVAPNNFTYRDLGELYIESKILTFKKIILTLVSKIKYTLSMQSLRKSTNKL